MRMPAVLDRKGIRWMIQVFSPSPMVIVLVHRGRSAQTLKGSLVQLEIAEPPLRA
jgi:hypothetical protein